MFKSYYVVWKLGDVDTYFLHILTFKSYYVVWKPSNFARTPIVYFCLNRTM